MRFLVLLGILLTLAQPGAAWAKSKAKPGAHPVAKTAPKQAAVPKGIGKAAEALILAEREKWAEAHKMAETSGDPLTVKLVRWLDFSRPNSGASFSQIASLIGETPGWPQQTLLQRRAEEAISSATPSEQILDWFASHAPIGADGGTAFGNALLNAGRTEEAHAVLKKTWANEDFGILQERQFLSKFREILSQDDHRARMMRLLWEGQTQSAERMMLFADAETRHLAHARLMLMKQKGTPAQALESVHEHLRSDPGLVFECLRWYRRKDMNEEAIRLLRTSPPDSERPELWWTERSIMARRALQMGFVSEAYEIAKRHGLSDGSSHADAEWLSGWIALRFLSDKEAAVRHFTQLSEKAQSSILKARGAYWLGRSLQAMGKEAEAKAQFEAASRFVTTYYGQLASEQLGPSQGWMLPTAPLPTEEDLKQFTASELVQAVRRMAEAGTPSLARPFLLKLQDGADTPGLKALTVSLAEKLGRIDLAVHLARRADRAGVTLIGSGWPVPPYEIPAGGPEKALLLALMRQESGFHAEAVSSAGARGLMQLMPATAKKQAQIMKIGYSPARISDPSVNIRLGTAYLDGLLSDFKGSYIMALAAYNAGPSRVAKWAREFGDPREAEVDAVDWVESIPFSETRGYVQRVMESVQVYRRRLGAETSTLALLTDLKRPQESP